MDSDNRVDDAMDNAGQAAADAGDAAADTSESLGQKIGDFFHNLGQGISGAFGGAKDDAADAADARAEGLALGDLRGVNQLLEWPDAGILMLGASSTLSCTLYRVDPTGTGLGDHVPEGLPPEVRRAVRAPR